MFKRFLIFMVLSCVIGCTSSPPLETRTTLDHILKIQKQPLTIHPVRFRIETSRRDYLTLIAGGDVMLGHWTLGYLEKAGSDYPFVQIAPEIKKATIAFANLEAPFADSGAAVEGKSFTFRVPVQHVRGLAKAGFNLLSIANNHILDYGLDGLAQTLTTLDSAGIAYAGAGLTLQDAWKPAVLETPAGRVVMLAFAMTYPVAFWATDSTGGTAYPYEARFAAVLDSLENEADYTIISFHWGTEKKKVPNDYQIYFAHLAIDHGADLVLGHHPHVTQGLELYKNKLIAYSLGNLAFSAYSKSAVHSMLLKIVLQPKGLLFCRVLPLNIDNAEVEFQPQFADAARRAQIYAELDSLSFLLNQRDIFEENGLIFGHFATEPAHQAPLNSAN